MASKKDKPLLERIRNINLKEWLQLLHTQEREDNTLALFPVSVLLISISNPVGDESEGQTSADV
jgi:hypothetical protein